jgi:hypothetical protein
MDETTATSEVRVATLNLWGRRGEWDERRPHMQREAMGRFGERFTASS